jgi:hypothetical protein
MTDTTNKEWLSKKAISLADKTESHLKELEGVIWKENLAESDAKKIAEAHHEIEAETATLMAEIGSDAETLLSEEAKTRLAHLKWSLEKLQGHAPVVEQTAEQQETKLDKVSERLQKRWVKTSLAVGIWSAVYGVYKEVKEAKGFFWTIGAFFKWVWKWIIVGWSTWLASKWIELWIDAYKYLEDKLKTAKDLMTNPWEAAMNMVKWIWWWFWSVRSTLTGYTPERYDPDQDEVNAEKADSNIMEEWLEWTSIQLVDGKGVVSFPWRKPEEIQITNQAETKVSREIIDENYWNPWFTDQLLITDKISWARIQSAMIEAEWQRFEWTTNTQIEQLHRIEEKRLRFHEALQNNAPKEEVLTLWKELIEKISHHEKDIESVVWSEWQSVIMPAINNHRAWAWEWALRENQFEKTYTTCLSAMRSLWGQWNSEIVKNTLLWELWRSEKYKDLLTIFHDDAMIDELRKVPQWTKHDDTIEWMIKDHIKTIGLEVPDGTIRTLTTTVMETYWSTRNAIHQPKQLEELKKHIIRPFFGAEPNLDVNKDEQGKAKMIAQYNELFGDQIATWKTKNPERKTERDVVWNFAWDMAKRNTLDTATQLAFQETFYDLYLPTQSTYEDKNTKEWLLATVMWSGEKFSDTVVAWAVWFVPDLLLACIPIGWTEIVAAKWLTRLWWLATKWMKAWRLAKATQFGIRTAWKWLIGHTLDTAIHTSRWKDPWSFFTNRADRQKLWLNFISYWFIGEIAPVLKAANIGKIWAPGGLVNATILKTIWSSRWKSLFANATEASMIEWWNVLFQEWHERSRANVLTVFALSSALSSRYGVNIRNYNLEAKVVNGKVQVACKWVNETTKKAVSALLHSETKRYNKRWVGMEKKINKRADEWKEILNDKGVSYILKKEGDDVVIWNTATKQVVSPSHPFIAKAIQEWQEKLANNIISKTTAKLSWSTQTIGSVCKKTWVKADEFQSRCKNHNPWRFWKWLESLTIGDLIKHIGNKQRWKLIFWQLATKKVAAKNASWKAITVWWEKVFVDGYENMYFKTLRNTNNILWYWSLLYGTVIGDGEDAWRDEWLENFVLYQIIWRGIIGKLILWAIDNADLLSAAKNEKPVA